MEKWKSYLKRDSTDWLLEEENPSVRYWALKDIVGKGEDDADVKKARGKIMESPVVKTILSKQDPKGFWVSPESFYLPKYGATYHQLLILSELGASPCEKVRKAIEFMFTHCQYESGHFSFNMIKTDRGKKSQLKDGACLTGNILRTLIHFGYLKDERTQKTVNFFLENYDEGWQCRVYPIDRKKVLPENCYMGGVKPLLAFSMIPQNERSKDMREIIKRGIEIYLENEVFMYLRDEKGKRKEKFGWTRFGFPLFYQSDALEVLDMLTRFGVKDARMKKALDLVTSKQNDEGRWRLENSFNGKMWANIEEKGKPSKWITLKAIRVLKRYYS
jgi:hypothetical protein